MTSLSSFLAFGPYNWLLFCSLVVVTPATAWLVTTLASEHHVRAHHDVKTRNEFLARLTYGLCTYYVSVIGWSAFHHDEIDGFPYIMIGTVAPLLFTLAAAIKVSRLTHNQDTTLLHLLNSTGHQCPPLTPTSHDSPCSSPIPLGLRLRFYAPNMKHLVLPFVAGAMLPFYVTQRHPMAVWRPPWPSIVWPHITVPPEGPPPLLSPGALRVRVLYAGFVFLDGQQIGSAPLIRCLTPRAYSLQIGRQADVTSAHWRGTVVIKSQRVTLVEADLRSLERLELNGIVTSEKAPCDARPSR
jgi:hypothetical protein